jgi:hypothetical protein
LVSEGAGDGIATTSKTRSDDHRGAAETEEEIPLSIQSYFADQGTPSKGTWSDKRERAKEKGMETDHSPSEMKE